MKISAESKRTRFKRALRKQTGLAFYLSAAITAAYISYTPSNDVVSDRNSANNQVVQKQGDETHVDFSDHKNANSLATIKTESARNSPETEAQSIRFELSKFNDFNSANTFSI
ncbi:hypothetical protein [Vibrio tapetis]|uniref:Uncharacterized protein n=1 Tax=Vibrio tapetis subsp. tapetis TaxID=1671868 RepID=A0A2N8Z9C5_9VIBR|nr:hypothetical protein [Vibrio tapetis]SON48487.1 exported protein of unknown function [Vibrio tapetis subsp. tapetis]